MDVFADRVHVLQGESAVVGRAWGLDAAEGFRYLELG